jgi:CheY-like chemotaxis protein
VGDEVKDATTPKENPPIHHLQQRPFGSVVETQSRIFVPSAPNDHSADGSAAESFSSQSVLNSSAFYAQNRDRQTASYTSSTGTGSSVNCPESALRKVKYRQSPHWTARSVSSQESGADPRSVGNEEISAAHLSDTKSRNLSEAKRNKAKESIFAMSASAPTEDFASASNKTPKFHVVILDDSPFDAESISMLCEAESYEVTIAATPQEALLLVEQKHIDIFIVDYHQPAPFEPLDFILKMIKGKVPIAIVSADDKIEYLSQCIAPIFVCGFFVKPLTYDNIQAFPRIAKVHQLAISQRRWQPPSIFYESGARVLSMVRRVLNQQFMVTVFTTDTEESQRVAGICQEVGRGVRYVCSAVETEQALETAVTAVAHADKDDKETTSPGSDTYDVDEDQRSEGQRPDLLLLDTRIPYQSMCFALEICQLHALPVICECFGFPFLSFLPLFSHSLCICAFYTRSASPTC